jgi:hypothetical protein
MGSFADIVLREGVTDPQAIVQWREALLWLTKANVYFRRPNIARWWSARSRRFPRFSKRWKGR